MNERQQRASEAESWLEHPFTRRMREETRDKVFRAIAKIDMTAHEAEHEWCMYLRVQEQWLDAAKRARDSGNIELVNMKQRRDRGKVA